MLRLSCAHTPIEKRIEHLPRLFKWVERPKKSMFPEEVEVFMGMTERVVTRMLEMMHIADALERKTVSAMDGSYVDMKEAQGMLDGAKFINSIPMGLRSLKRTWVDHDTLPISFDEDDDPVITVWVNGRGGQSTLDRLVLAIYPGRIWINKNNAGYKAWHPCMPESDTNKLATILIGLMLGQVANIPK